MAALTPAEFTQKLEGLGEKANTHEGYENFRAAALALTQKDDAYINAVMSQYHKDGANNHHLPCLSIIFENGHKSASIQTEEGIKKGACSASPEFAKASGVVVK